MNWCCKITRSITASAFCAVSVAHASPQEQEEKPVDLGSINIVEQVVADQQTPQAIYDISHSVDSGTTVMGEEVVNTENRGDINTTELLKMQPFVQMDINRRDVSRESVQNLRPSNFTISGGNYYNNNIMVNGVPVNSIMDVTGDSPFHYNEVSGQTAQSLYIDPSLIGEVVVHDSNVSAEYGGFTGGVVEFNVRQPKDVFSVSVKAGYQSDSFVDYRLADKEELDLSTLEREPAFSKYRTSVSVDVPVNERLKFLAAYTRAESSVDYFLSEKYGGEKFNNGDLSENFLLKGVYEISHSLNAEGQIIYSPFDSEARSANGIHNLIVSNSGGLSAYLKLTGSHDVWDWESQLSFSQFEGGRDAPGNNFSWPSGAEFVNWCSSTNCTEGGFGALDQDQKDYNLTFKASRLMWQGIVSFGADLNYIDAIKERTKDNFAYSRGLVFSSLECPEGDPGCVDNMAVLRQYSIYQAYSANATVGSQALWAEYAKEWTSFDVRAGIRYNHDDFLDNYNLAPRFAANWKLTDDISVTFGLNRYFGKNNVGYAVRSQYPDNYIYRRTTTTDTNGVEQVNDWTLYRHTRSADYTQANLDTPYSDELTLAFTFNTPLNGQLRVKGVKRHRRDALARSPSVTVNFDAPTATSSTTRSYTVTNAGSTNYEGLSVEWNGQYKNHAFALNGTWSKTRNFGGVDNYFEIIDEEELYNAFVYYKGSVISEDRLYDIQERANFSTPFRAYANWTANWFDDYLKTSTSVHYRGSYEQIIDTRDNITIDNERFDIYDKVTRSSHTSVSLKALLTVYKGNLGRAALEFRVDNLLNDLPHTETSRSNPYQEGRSYWVEASYTF